MTGAVGPASRGAVFDLDGTLIDSLPDLAGALNRSLACHGKPPLERSEVAAMVGDGATVLLRRGYAARGLEPSPSDLTMFLNDYEAHAAELTEPFPGIPEVLADLRVKGLALAVCTNKPEASARKVLAALDLEDYFCAIIGGDAIQYRKPDPRHLQAVLAAIDVSAANAVMIGDHRNDMLAASGSNVVGIFVAWGYGTADAVYRVDQPAELPATIAAALEHS